MPAARKRKWEAQETCVCFNFINLLRNVRSEVRTRVDRGKEPERYRAEILAGLEAYEVNGQRFKYSTVPNRLGGVRWYVRCPKCDSRTMKLFLPTRYPDREQRYLCAKCHRLQQTSLVKGKSKKYKTIIRPLKRMQKLKDMLMNTHLTPDEAKPLIDEYENLSKNLKNTPEYRLWKFKMEHGGLG